MREERNYSVLVCAADELLRHSICAVLQRNGYDSIGVGAIAEAIVCFGQSEFDLFISNVHPNLIDALSLIQAVQTHHPTKAIAMYGDISESAKVLLLNGGFNYLLKIPFSFQALVRLTETLLPPKQV